MTPQQHTALLIEQGTTTTAAVQQLAHILLCTERTAWRYLQSTRHPSPACELLLDIWHKCPAARPLWPTKHK